MDALPPDAEPTSNIDSNIAQMPRLHIADFCDMKRFEKVLDDWAKATGLATVAVDENGEYISDCYNFTVFCHGLTRKSPEGLRRCKECDKKGSGIYLCHAGLVDFAAPITLEDGTLLGNIVGGQVLPARPDEARFRATARELDIDEDAYIKALRNVNVRSHDEIEASFDLLASVVNMFVRTSYTARKNAASLSERAGIISSLSKIYFCDYYIDLAADEFLELDATDELHAYSGNRGCASKLIADSCRYYAEPEYVDDFLAFTDLSTLESRIQERQSVAYEFVCKDSGWCRAVFIAVDRNAKGHISHVIYALQYIQEEKEKELETQAALKSAAEKANRANLAKSDFLSRMSHDIRTPLNGIIGMTYLTEKMDLPQEAYDNLAKIDTSSKFLLSLINDVLDMSKAESSELELHPEPYPDNRFFDYLDAIIKPLCEEKHLKLVIESDLVKGVIPLMDELRINQVFFNLFSNAVKYTPEGGTITYRIQTHTTPGNKLAVQGIVSDTGIGMSEQFQETVFEPFTQENRIDNSEMHGTGLGLAIVKRLLDAMGGTIRVESKPGKGSSFILEAEFDYIPADEYKPEHRELSDNIDDSTDLSGKHILLCEDHPLNQEIAKAILESSGMIVEIADDGESGVEAFEKSAIGYYDCILMDIRMPIMNGYQATSCIRSLSRSDAACVPIIAMTADAFSDDVKKCIEVGMSAHVSKPVEPDTLVSVLASVLSDKAI